MDTSLPRPAVPARFDLLIKPAGAACNLDCTYCFYLEKPARLASGAAHRMRDAVLETLTRQYLEARPTGDVIFAWQGGEPTLLGIEFFERALALQERFGPGRRIRNTLQTNGVLLDDAWGGFLARNHFLVGLSLDGPAALHDPYRRDHAGRPTHDAVLRGLDVLRRHGVEFNTLTTINRRTAREPDAVYQFLKDSGSRHWQFIPVVERLPEPAPANGPHDLGTPPGSEGPGTESAVTDWSVDPHDYGRFLMAVFDRWVRADVGRIHVQFFEVALGNWLRADAGLCLFAETCGRGPVLEANGDLFACDHYVLDRYRLGNLLETPLVDLVRHPRLHRFGRHKSEALPGYCRRCPYLFACRGECPKHRFARTPDGEPGLNHLCPAYRAFFAHADPCFRVMAQLLMQGRPAAGIMDLLKAA